MIDRPLHSNDKVNHILTFLSPPLPSPSSSSSASSPRTQASSLANREINTIVLPYRRERMSSHYSSSSSSSSPPFIPGCPFCNISQTYAPFSPNAPPSPLEKKTISRPRTQSELQSQSRAQSRSNSLFSSSPPEVSPNTSPTPIEDEKEEVAYTILSTPHVLAFLDHMPITRGHVLLTTRQHREKLKDVTISEAAILGAWLQVLSRAVMRAVGILAVGQGIEDEDIKRQEMIIKGENDFDVKDWNVVQNNGARAAQVVNHVHYHIIPRPGEVPELKNRSWTMFGRGQRGDLDEEEAIVVRDRIRLEIKREVDGLSIAERRILGLLERGKL